MESPGHRDFQSVANRRYLEEPDCVARAEETLTGSVIKGES